MSIAASTVSIAASNASSLAAAAAVPLPQAKLTPAQARAERRRLAKAKHFTRTQAARDEVQRVKDCEARVAYPITGGKRTPSASSTGGGKGSAKDRSGRRRTPRNGEGVRSASKSGRMAENRRARSTPPTSASRRRGESSGASGASGGRGTRATSKSSPSPGAVPWGAASRRNTLIGGGLLSATLLIAQNSAAAAAGRPSARGRGSSSSRNTAGTGEALLRAATMRMPSPSSPSRGGAKRSASKPFSAGLSQESWQALALQLPTGRSEAERVKRKQMFNSFDCNGNGYLSLAEVQKGVRDVLQSDALFDAKPAIMRAFQAAKNAVDTKTSLGVDFIERAEFRALLVYLQRYFELYAMFQRMDTGNDHRINVGEFMAALSLLMDWGLEIDDPAAAFAAIDRNGGGEILFDEFCEWALTEHLSDLVTMASKAGEQPKLGFGSTLKRHGSFLTAGGHGHTAHLRPTAAQAAAHTDSPQASRAGKAPPTVSAANASHISPTSRLLKSTKSFRATQDANGVKNQMGSRALPWEEHDKPGGSPPPANSSTPASASKSSPPPGAVPWGGASRRNTLIGGGLLSATLLIAADLNPTKRSPRQRLVLEELEPLFKNLPTGRNESARERRKSMFNSFDPNGNGYLSLAEVQKGVRDVLKCDALFDAKPAIMRAFTAAKNAVDTKSRLGADFVERAEFRALLVYLQRYFELYVMFKVVDTGADHRINELEFTTALPLLLDWGLDVDDPASAFAAIDRNGGGKILFNEFCDWALPLHLAKTCGSVTTTSMSPASRLMQPTLTASARGIHNSSSPPKQRQVGNAGGRGKGAEKKEKKIKTDTKEEKRGARAMSKSSPPPGAVPWGGASRRNTLMGGGLLSATLLIAEDRNPSNLSPRQRGLSATSSPQGRGKAGAAGHTVALNPKGGFGSTLKRHGSFLTSGGHGHTAHLRPTAAQAAAHTDSPQSNKKNAVAEKPAFVSTTRKNTVIGRNPHAAHKRGGQQQQGATHEGEEGGGGRGHGAILLANVGSVVAAVADEPSKAEDVGQGAQAIDRSSPLSF